MNIRRLILLYSSLFTFHFSLLFAQMDNVVEVENTYTPVLRDVDKLQLLPPVQSPVLSYKPVEYDTSLRPTHEYSFQPMQAAKSDAADEGSPRRFVRLAGGTVGQIDARGAYGLRLSSDDLLDFDFSLRGYSAKVQDAWTPAEKLPMRFYSTRGAVGYQHNFAPTTALKLSGDFESQVMNGQHNTLFSVGAQLTPWKMGDFSLGGSASFENFSQKYDNNAFISSRHNRESHFMTTLNSHWCMDGEQSIGLNLQADFFTYAFNAFKSNHTFDLHPYYTYRTDDLQLTLGARLDFFTGVEGKFRAAPDAEVRYHASDALTFFGQAGGGTVANSYRHFAALHPYWIFSPFFQGKNDLPQLTHQFDYIRSAAGMEWNPTTGFFARFYGGFNKSTGRAELLAGNSLVQANAWQWYAHADLRYDYKDVFCWTFNGQYNIWHSEYGTNSDANKEAVAWRPIIDITTEARVQPVHRLTLTADYAFQTFSLHSGLPYHRPVTSNLGASVSYQVPLSGSLSRTVLTAFVRGDNLLGRHYDLYPCVRTSGANVLGGFNFTF